MSKIRVLPDSLANKIAAGEVVERPASIVKELIENSIDAGAGRIEVAVESGGRRLIRVADDGEGMSRDDAILAFERHATSKIKSAEDLEAILTLGFRGEALASIASVSKVRLRTQTADDLVGTEIEISGGRMLNVRDIAFARGTEFEIRDLFFNVPARRKFLKSEATESFHIASLVTHYALAHPRLAFTLINNGRESISVTPVGDLRERAYQLFGGEFIDDLIEVSGENGELNVRGFVSSPSVTRTTRDSQYFFINGRYVRDKLISRALGEAYRAMMPVGVYPTAMLFVGLPPHEVDVNVHPAKTEVRFVRPSIVQDTLRDAVRAAIGAAKAAVTPFIEKQQETSRVETTTRPPGAASLDQLSTTAQPLPISREELKGAFRIQAPKPPPAPEQRKMNLSFAPQPQQKGEAASPPIEEPLSDYAIGAEDSVLPVPVSEGAVREEKPEEPVVIYYGSRLGCLGARRGDLSNSNLKPPQNLSLNADEINPLGQLHNSFILAADRNGLLAIDQHVAHERILFERHWRALTRNRVEVQRLLLPETLDLTPAQAATIDQMLPELEENGFEIGRLSGRTIAIKAVPALLPAGTARELLVTDNPATCPHGRPIILRVSTREIEKGFQRS